MMEQHRDELPTEEMLAAECIPEVPGDTLLSFPTNADQAFFIGRLEEAITAALCFAGRLRRSVHKQAIQSRLIFVQEQLNAWFRKCLGTPDEPQHVKEGK
jgi:hypothetical protein